MRVFSDLSNGMKLGIFGGKDRPEKDADTASGLLRLSSGTVIFMMFVAMLAAFGSVLFKVLDAEKEAGLREIKSVSRVFATHKQRLLDEIERYAASNSAYLNVETRFDRAWIEDRFGVDMALDFSHDAVLLAGTGNEILYLRDLYGKKTIESYGGVLAEKLAPALDEIRQNYRQNLSIGPGDIQEFSGPLSAVSTVDLVELNGGISIVSAFAIVPDPGGIPVKNTSPPILIAVYDLDEIHLSNILSNLSLDNLIFSADVPEGMLGMPVANNQGRMLGYLAWYPMSRASSIILASGPVLALSIGVIFAIALVTLRQNAATKHRLAEREREARHVANHDSMTGFTSRAHFNDIAETVLASLPPDCGYSGLIYLDIDRLKQVNDVYGHLAGDKLIVHQARRIAASLGPADLVGRIGGDEFLILLGCQPSPEELVAVLDRLMSNLSQELEIDGMHIEASCSAGLAMIPENGKDLGDLIRMADIALQRCKQEGRNSYRIFDARMDAVMRETRQIRQDLNSALAGEEFELFYQPIVDAQSGAPVMAEALIRWNHPRFGLVMPDRFVSVAQSAGLMADIGGWVLQKAVSDACEWPDIGVSVNVCTSQLHVDGFVDQVEQVLDRFDFPPDRLTLEITEALMLEQSARTEDVFNRLRTMGVGLAIDDFGTGYSSLSYLNKYRFDRLKIDRSFVARIGKNDGADKLVQSLVGLAKVLDMRTIGEGVETDEQRAFLVEHGCDCLQGYYYDRPLPIGKWQDWISERLEHRAFT